MEKPEETTAASHTRKKAGRNPLPEDLPRVDVIHELSEEERQCQCGCLKDYCGQELSEQMIPKSMATPGLLAHILTAKFADALPFYRQEKQFARIRVELPRSSKARLSCSNITRQDPQIFTRLLPESPDGV